MTDPETWVGQRVSLLSGKHAGHQGKVLSSGNGWVQILTTQGEEVAKRAYELQVIEINSLGSSADVHVKKKARFGRNPNHHSSLNAHQRNHPDFPIGDASATTSRYAIHPPTGTDYHKDSAQNGTAHRQRGRPRAYSDSLMSASNCPTGELGFASNAGFKMSSSTASMKSASEIFATSPKPPSSRGPPLKNPAHIEAKKSYITKYVNRHLQKINGRPNLVDWKQQIDVGIVNSTIFERQTAQLFEETYCEVCNLEKWSNAKFCWNEGCPVSPVYFKLTGLSAPYQQHNAEFMRNNSIDPHRHPQQFQHERVMVEVREEDEEVVDENFRSVDLTSNVVNDYLLQLPSQLIGRDCRRTDDEVIPGAHASVVWEDSHHDNDNYSRSKDDQTVMSLAPVKVSAHSGDGVQSTFPVSLNPLQGTLQGYTHRNISNDSLISLCTDGMEGSKPVKGSGPSIFYSQYFSRTAERSESFAETDSEVKSATANC